GLSRMLYVPTTPEEVTCSSPVGNHLIADMSPAFSRWAWLATRFCCSRLRVRALMLGTSLADKKCEGLAQPLTVAPMADRPRSPVGCPPVPYSRLHACQVPRPVPIRAGVRGLIPLTSRGQGLPRCLSRWLLAGCLPLPLYRLSSDGGWACVRGRPGMRAGR